MTTSSSSSFYDNDVRGAESFPYREISSPPPPNNYLSPHLFPSARYGGCAYRVHTHRWNQHHRLAGGPGELIKYTRSLTECDVIISFFSFSRGFLLRPSSGQIKIKISKREKGAKKDIGRGGKRPPSSTCQRRLSLDQRSPKKKQVPWKKEKREWRKKKSSFVILSLASSVAECARYNVRQKRRKMHCLWQALNSKSKKGKEMKSKMPDLAVHHTILLSLYKNDKIWAVSR